METIKVIVDNQNEGISTWLVIIVTALLTAGLSALFNYLSTRKINKQQRDSEITKVLLERRMKAHQELIEHITNYAGIRDNNVNSNKELGTNYDYLSNFIKQNSSYLTRDVLLYSYLIIRSYNAIITISDLSKIPPFFVINAFASELIEINLEAESKVQDFFENQINNPYTYTRNLNLVGMIEDKYSLILELKAVLNGEEAVESIKYYEMWIDALKQGDRGAEKSIPA